MKKNSKQNDFIELTDYEMKLIEGGFVETPVSLPKQTDFMRLDPSKYDIGGEQPCSPNRSIDGKVVSCSGSCYPQGYLGANANISASPKYGLCQMSSSTATCYCKY